MAVTDFDDFFAGLMQIIFNLAIPFRCKLRDSLR